MSAAIASSETSAAGAEKFYGKYPGRVLKQEAPPASGDYGGQLWVEVPGILEDDPSDTTGTKKRPLQVRALPCFPPGFFFVPEPGAHVWVEFAAGDINQAIWTGVWYPPKADPETFRSPRTVDGKPPTRHQRIIRTPTGNVIQLDDSGEGGEAIELVNKTHKRRVRLDKDGILLQFGEGSERVIKMNESGIEISFKTDSGKQCITLNDAGIVIETAQAKLVLESSCVKVSDGTGTKSLQLVLLAPLIDGWLKKHQHAGNMGGPTPLFADSLLELTLPATLNLFRSGSA